MEECSNTIRYIWKLENYCFCDFYCNAKLKSPPFKVNKPVPCTWFLYMFPNGFGIEKFVGIYLKRPWKDNGPEEIRVRFKISLLNTDGILCPETAPIEEVFTKDCEWGHNEFIKRSELTTGSTYLYQDILTVICHITILGPNHSDSILHRDLSLQPGVNEDKNRVCKAIKLIYQDNLYSDMTLKGENKTFSVHKCILRARLPGLFRKLESEPDSAFNDNFFTEKVLSYAYCGKLDIKDVNPFIIKQSLAKYELLHLEKDLIPQSCEYFAQTYISIEKYIHSWKILTSLLNEEGDIVSSFISDGFRNTGFLVNLSKRDGGVWSIRIKASNSNNDEVFVRCNISVRHPESNGRVSDVFEHTCKSGDWWQSPATVKLENDTLVFSDQPYNFKSDFFYLDFIFTYPSGKVQSSLEIVTSDDSSLTSLINDSKNLLLDLENLYNNQYESDTIITAGNKLFRVHKCILCARSPYFRAMFMHDMAEKEHNKAELKSNEMDESTFAEVVDKLLLFTYCGKFEAKSRIFAAHLLNAIEMYMIGEDYETT